MSDTVQIPEDVKVKIFNAVTEYAKVNSPKQITIPAYHDGAYFGYNICQEKLQSFRKKLENITIDELLSNPKIVLDMFDKEFGI